jgi:predicted nucleotidyltransferase
MRRDEAITRLRELKPLLDRHGVKRLRVFGSVARDEAEDRSDIDLIVDLVDGKDLLDFIGIKLDLAEALGVNVDLATPNSLHPYLRARILAEAIDAFAA